MNFHSVTTKQIAKPKISLEVRIEDPSASVKEKRLFIENVKAAMALWKIQPSYTVTIEVLVRVLPDNQAKFSAYSKTSAIAYRGTDDEHLRQGVAHEIISGKDPNGSKEDMVILMDSVALSKVWLDPNPYKRNEVMPDNLVDFVSVIAHEIGHALCFNGFYDIKNQVSRLSSGKLSSYDKQIMFVADKPFFVGTRSVELFGEMIPLRHKDKVYTHLSLTEKQRGAFGESLMADTSIQKGKRYYLTELDKALMRDCGLSVN